MMRRLRRRVGTLVLVVLTPFLVGAALLCPAGIAHATGTLLPQTDYTRNLDRIPDDTENATAVDDTDGAEGTSDHLEPPAPGYAASDEYNLTDPGSSETAHSARAALCAKSLFNTPARAVVKPYKPNVGYLTPATVYLTFSYMLYTDIGSGIDDWDNTTWYESHQDGARLWWKLIPYNIPLDYGDVAGDEVRLILC